MRKLIGFVSMLVLFCVAMSVTALPAQAQGGGGNSKRGTVTMKSQSNHGGAAQGQGTVTPNGGYYVAPTVSCTLTLSGMNLVNIPDGAQVLVTLEYLDPTMAPVVVGTITIAHGGGSISTGSNPIPVSLASPINSMSVRKMDGTVIMSGTVRGL